MAEAMELIKHHDAYVLEKKDTLQKVDAPDRRLKVYEGSDSRYNAVSQIRLQGKWLEELGFEPGILFIVKCEMGKLILTIE